MQCTPSASHGRLTLGSIAGHPAGFGGCAHCGLPGVGTTGVVGTGVGLTGVGVGVGFGAGFGAGRGGVGLFGLGRLGAGLFGASAASGTTAAASIDASAIAASTLGGGGSRKPQRTTTMPMRTATATHAANARLTAGSGWSLAAEHRHVR